MNRHRGLGIVAGAVGWASAHHRKRQRNTPLVSDHAAVAAQHPAVDPAANVIAQVGSSGGIVGHDLLPLGIGRGQNALWNKGGLQHTPPFR